MEEVSSSLFDCALLFVLISYHPIWETQKEAFFRRYRTLDPSVSQFDADIQRSVCRCRSTCVCVCVHVYVYVYVYLCLCACVYVYVTICSVYLGSLTVSNVNRLNNLFLSCIYIIKSL